MSIENQPLSALLAGFSLDLPKLGEQHGLLCSIAGWVLGNGVEVDSIEVTMAGAVLRRMPADLPRPDVQAHFSGEARALRTGFQSLLSLHFLPPKGVLKLRARLKTQPEQAVDLVLVHYEHDFRASLPQTSAVLQPLVVSAIGRSGTTWLLHLLNQHPQIVAYPAYPYELHVGAYFQHLLRVVMSPADYTYSSTPTGFWFDHAHVGHPPFQAAPPMGLDELDAWLSASLWSLTADYVVRVTDRFYRGMAQRQGKQAPAFFAEKQVVPWFGWLTRAVYSAPKEIFLVRDFRDVFCSILAFNRKRGVDSFGRERVDSDAAYAAWLNVEISILVENWLARAHDSLLVRYEELVRCPVEVLAQVFAYLGIDHSRSLIEQVLRTAREKSSMLEGHSTAQDAEQSIARWRSELSPELAQVVESVFADNLRAVGYLP